MADNIEFERIRETISLVEQRVSRLETHRERDAEERQTVMTDVRLILQKIEALNIVLAQSKAGGDNTKMFWSWAFTILASLAAVGTLVHEFIWGKP